MIKTGKVKIIKQGLRETGVIGVITSYDSEMELYQVLFKDKPYRGWYKEEELEEAK